MKLFEFEMSSKLILSDGSGPKKTNPQPKPGWAQTLLKELNLTLDDRPLIFTP